jgi:ribosomal protein L16/L10AE
VLFEMGGITLEDAKESLRLASAKLPILTKFVIKE